MAQLERHRLISQGMGNDLAAVGIQCQMQLAPTATGSGAVVLLEPLTRAVDLHAGAADKNMHWSLRRNLAIMPFVGRLPCPRPTAQGGMIGDSERQPHQLQHRFQQAFCLAQPQAWPLDPLAKSGSNAYGSLQSF